jgi:hypothetical protein
LTRAERFSLLSPAVAIVGAAAAWGGYFVNSANRQDTIGQVAQTQFDAKVDSRIDTKLASVLSSLRDKEDTVTGTKQIETVRGEQSNALQAIHSELEKTNTLVGGTKEELAKLTGKMDTLERDVNLLLERQLRSAADLPNTALASQLPNVAFLYQMATRRGIRIPTEIDTSIRWKLASIGPTGPAYWSVAAITISRESEALMGGNLKVGGTLEELTVDHNTFFDQRVLLDGAHFSNNLFVRCIIEYRGGATDVNSNGFDHCLFIISTSGTPPPTGQKVIQSLLASDLQLVRIG